MSRACPLLSALVAVLLAAPAFAGDESAQEILDCVEKNQPERTARQTLQFRSEDRAGGGRSILSKMQWKRFEDGLSKVLLRVHGPADLKGSGVLLIEKKTRADMFVYLPDLRKTRRVTSRMLGGSLFGSDFTYEDFSNLQGMSVAGRAERLPDADLDGVAVQVVAHHPNGDTGSAYARVTSFIEPATCVPLRIEMYEEGERLRKVLTAERGSVFEQNGARLPRKMLMEDLRDQSRTHLEITEIEVDAEIPKKAFSLTSLERPRVN